MRKPKTISLQIPEPCHEDWQQMTPTERGRFCSSCQKEVLSFTDMTDAQVIAFFKKRPTNVCGQFRPEQLRTYHLAPEPQLRTRFGALAVGSLISVMTVGSTAASAQEKMGEVVRVVDTAPTCTDAALDKVEQGTVDSLHAFTGRVLNMNTGSGMPNVTLQIKGTDIGTHTDAEGRFCLTIPESHRQKPFAVSIRATGHVGQERVLIPDQLPMQQTIQMIPEPNVRGGVEPSVGQTQMIMGKMVAPQR